jgi:orotidine-5'-phosphate decarboxylase
MNFYKKLLSAARTNNSWLCVGLDPELSKIPPSFGSGVEAILKFNKTIIDLTGDLVCAYKPNAAFYEAHGVKGWETLHETIKYIPSHIPIILDCKRGDIGNTAKMYAQAAFDILGVDAVTVNPYMGKDSMEPFLNYKEKGVFVLCLTSNPSAAEIQRQTIHVNKSTSNSNLHNNSEMELFLRVAELVTEWNIDGNAGLVVGATKAGDLKAVRAKIGNEIPILIPGVGAQGGDLEQSISLGSNTAGEMAIINIARGVIYAGHDLDYRTAIRDAALNYRKNINSAIEKKRNA